MLHRIEIYREPCSLNKDNDSDFTLKLLQTIESEYLSAAVAFDIETTFDNSLTPTVTLSSKAPLTAPCDICHRKVKQLFALNQKGLTFFVCCYCYKERYKNCSKVTRSFVNPRVLDINPQPKLKWDDICTYGQQFTLVLDKVRKTNRKNKKV